MVIAVLLDGHHATPDNKKTGGWCVIAASNTVLENKQAGREGWGSGDIGIHHSGWTLTGRQVKCWPSLEEALDTDHVVIGAGLAGSSLALHLARQGVAVVVLEARQPGWGASGRNAGHVLPTLRNLQVFERFPDRGRRFLSLFDEWHTLPFQLAREYAIDCDAVQSGYLNAMQTPTQLQRFNASMRHWQGRQQIYELGAEEMRSMTGSARYPHGVLYASGGRINPWLFSNGLTNAAVGHGARVYGDTEALAIQPVGQRWKVITARGEVTAARVIFCTNAYPTNIVPAFTNCYYPLTAYALATAPLPEPLREIIMPGRQTLAQVPMDLHPLVIDEQHRLVTASIPSARRPHDAAWHFRQHLRWIHRTWPEASAFPLELQAYWTGRVAMRDQQFPGIYEVQPGVYGLMHFNAWGNVMAPLLGKLLGEALAADDLASLPFPVQRPQAVSFAGKHELLVRKLLIPAARLAQRLGVI